MLKLKINKLKNPKTKIKTKIITKIKTNKKTNKKKQQNQKKNLIFSPANLIYLQFDNQQELYNYTLIS